MSASAAQLKKEKEIKRREEAAKAAKEAKEEAKRLKQLQQKEEQKRKSEAGSKVKKPAIGLEAILQAEKEAEEMLAVRRAKEVDLLARDVRGAANGAGDELLFEKKLTKEEKKAAAAAKRAEKSKTSKKKNNDADNESNNDVPETESGVASLIISGDGEEAKGVSGKSKKASKSALSRVEQQKEELEQELEAAKIKAATSRNLLGAYKGAIEASSFTLPNPGGGAPLLEDAACTLVRGKCYGLIGRNGKGKSTMLRAFAARRVGNVPSNVTVHYVTQDVHLTQAMQKMTPVQVVVEADIELRLLLIESKELDRLADLGELDESGQLRQAEVIERLDMIDADSAERRADELLINLGFSDELRSREMCALSGGWRVRTMLAAAIFARPDMLLLDEPTNHLSITAVLWLARELKESAVWKDRIIIIVSHDRYFLDEVCTDVLHISGAARRLTQSHGNYTTWAARRAEQQQVFEKETNNRQAEIDKMKEFAGHGFKYGGSSNSINKMKMLEKQAGKLEVEAQDQAEELAALQEDIELPLKMMSGGELPGFIVQMKEVSFGYPGSKCLFADADFSVTSKSRIVLLGENGNGKTTLVKLMLGELVPTSGEVLIKANARVALVNQHHADQIDLDLTPLQYMLKEFPAPEGTTAFNHLQRLRSHLAGCGVTGGSSTKTGGGNGSALGNNQIFDLQNTPAKALSGGQRSRVAMAAVSFKEPHVLVLDEPTNNLDLESVAALADSIVTFQGAVVCVSHDQFFVNKIANEAWVVGNGRVKRVESFEAYRKVQLNRLNKTNPMKK